MKRLFYTILISFLFLICVSSANAGICDDTDALKLIEATMMHSTQAGPGSNMQPIQDIYKNKWLISCAVANGITNLDKAGDYLMRPDVLASYSGMIMGGRDGNTDISTNNAKRLAESMKTLAATPAFQHSVVDRTRVIGMYILLLSFMIGIGAKLYGLILGADNSDAIDFALLFIRFITILLFISFMKPLAFYGMQISTVVSSMLLDSPIQIVVSSNVGYTGPGSLQKNTSGGAPWFSGNYTVTSGFGLRDLNKDGNITMHKGVDFGASTGTRITMPYTGIATCKNNPGGYGTYIEVIPTDSPNERHRVGHLSECRYEGDADLAKSFKKGKSIPVSSGEGIGLSGNSGKSTGAHIHVDVAVGGVFKDPGQVYAVRSGTAAPTTTTPASTGNPSATGATQAGTNVAGAYAYEGNDTLTVDALFSELMRLKSASLKAKGSFHLWDLVTGGFTYFFTYIASWLALVISGAILSVLIILADTMMAITLALGPIVAALTLIPPFENYLQNWIKGYITFLFYQPLAACFTILMFVMMAVTMDTGFSGFIILAICYVVGCMKIPSIADGLSTSALVGVAMMMAFAPAMMVVKAASMGAGMALGGPGGAMAASGAVNAVTNVAKAESGGKGFIKIKLLIAMVMITVLLSCGCAHATISAEEKKDLMNIMKPVSYPSPELVNDVNNMMDKDGLIYSGEGGMTSIGTNGVSVYNDGDDDNDINGIYNTSYLDAIDMPMTRFVLGKANIDAGMIYEMAFIASYKTKFEDASARQLSTFLLENSALGNTSGIISVVGKISNTVAGAVSSLGTSGDELRAQIRSKGDVVSSFLFEAQQAITHKLMFWVPFYVLILMFFIQIGVISYIKIAEPTIGDKASYVMAIPRLVLFMLFIYFFRDFVGICITFSNYISNAIVPIETQRSLMANITTKTGAMIPGKDISCFMVATFRLFTYMAVKILLMARDIFMTITVIVGPLCIALGYFTRYRNPDYIHQFFSGWIENFVKLLFWGPLAAIMLFCLGILSVLTALDMMSVISVAVTAMAFLYAAGNIPNMAEKMSSVALGGLLLAMSPIIMKGLMLGGRGAVGGAFGAGRLVGATGIFAGLNMSLANFGGRVKGGVSNILGGGGSPLSKFGQYFNQNPTGNKNVNSTSTPIINPVGAGTIGAGNALHNKLKNNAFNKIGDHQRQNIQAGLNKNIDGQNSTPDKAGGTIKSQSDMPYIPTKDLGKNKSLGVNGQPINETDVLSQFKQTEGLNGGMAGKLNANKVIKASILSKLLGHKEFGVNSGEVNEAVETINDSVDLKMLDSVVKNNKFTVKELFMGKNNFTKGNITDGLVGHEDFINSSGLSGQSEPMKAALTGIMGLRFAESQIDSLKGTEIGRANPHGLFQASEILKFKEKELDSFVKTYTAGGFDGLSERELTAEAMSITSKGLNSFDSLKSTHNVVSSLPTSAQGWLKNNGGIDGVTSMVNDIRSQEVSYSDIFETSANAGQNPALEKYGIKSTVTNIEQGSLQMLGLSVMREIARESNDSNMVSHIDNSISEISHLTNQGNSEQFTTNMQSIVTGAVNTFNSSGLNRPMEYAYSKSVSDNVVNSLPGEVQGWLSNSIESNGLVQMVDDIKTQHVSVSEIFEQPYNPNNTNATLEQYNIATPTNLLEHATVQLLGLNVMKEIASKSNDTNTVETIDNSIAKIIDIAKEIDPEDMSSIDTDKFTVDVRHITTDAVNAFNTVKLNNMSLQYNPIQDVAEDEFIGGSVYSNVDEGTPTLSGTNEFESETQPVARRRRIRYEDNFDMMNMLKKVVGSSQSYNSGIHRDQMDKLGEDGTAIKNET